MQHRIQSGLAGDIEDTPKAGDAIFRRCYSELVGTNIQALIAANQTAKKLNYQPLILSSTIKDEAREVVKMNERIKNK